jgi:hypothetical protein
MIHSKLQSSVDQYMLDVLKDFDKGIICHLLYYYQHFSQHVYIQLYFRVKDKVDHAKLSLNKTLPLSLIHQDISLWNWKRLTQVRDVQEILTNTDLPWCMETFSSKCPFEFFSEHINDIQWDWIRFSYNNNIPIEYILDTLDKHPWHISFISLRCYTTPQALRILKLYPNVSISNNMYTYVTSVTCSDVESHPDLDWNYKLLSLNRNISLEFIDKYSYKDWDWFRVFLTPKPLWFIQKYRTKIESLTSDIAVCVGKMVTVDDMIANPDIKWNITKDSLDESQCAKFLAYYHAGKIRAETDRQYLRCLFPKRATLKNKVFLKDKYNLPLDVVFGDSEMTYHDMYTLFEKYNVGKIFKSYWISNKLINGYCDFDDLVQYYKLFYHRLDVVSNVFEAKSVNIESFARRHMAAYKIQKWWLDHYYNPAKPVCRKRLRREYEELQEHDFATYS